MRFTLGSLALTLAIPSLALATPSYSLTPMGDLPGGPTMSWGHALNNHGDAVGAGATEESFPGVSGLLYSEGELTELIGFPGSDPYGSRINALSDSGIAVGRSFVSFGHQATVWEDGVSRGLGYAGGCGDGLYSVAYDVSRSGTVLGATSASTCQTETFLWRGAGLSLLPSSPEGYGSSVGAAISPSGRLVAGHVNRDSGTRVPFWWHEGAEELLLLPSPGDDGYALDINDHGQIISHAIFQDTGRTDGLLWSSDGTYVLLPPLVEGHTVMRPMAINNVGEVVGTSGGAGSGGSFLWSAELGSVATQGLVEGAEGWDLYGFEDINEFGQIVGTGFNPQGQSEGFILTLIDDGTFGECCIEGGACQQAKEARCDALGGGFHGVGVTCEGEGCVEPPARGACCVDYECEMLDPLSCAERGGFYQGDGLTCPEDPCTPSSCSNGGGGGPGAGAGALLLLSTLIVPAIFRRRYRRF